jgi:hypothetical protein
LPKAGEQRFCIGRIRLAGVSGKWCGIEKQGSGFRGGNWNNTTVNARVSDRNNAANVNGNRNNNNGARCAKTLVLTMRTEACIKTRFCPFPEYYGYMV